VCCCRAPVRHIAGPLYCPLSFCSMQSASHAALTVPQLRQEMLRRGLPIPPGANKRDLVNTLDSQPTVNGNFSNLRAAALLSMRSSPRPPLAPAAEQCAGSPRENVRTAPSSAPLSVEAQADLLDRTLSHEAAIDAFATVLRLISQLDVTTAPSMNLQRLRFLHASGAEHASSLSSRQRSVSNDYLVISRAASSLCECLLSSTYGHFCRRTQSMQSVTLLPTFGAWVLRTGPRFVLPALIPDPH
jgi:hypothetical protein